MDGEGTWKSFYERLAIALEVTHEEYFDKAAVFTFTSQVSERHTDPFHGKKTDYSFTQWLWNHPSRDKRHACIVLRYVSFQSNNYHMFFPISIVILMCTNLRAFKGNIDIHHAIPYLTKRFEKEFQNRLFCVIYQFCTEVCEAPIGKGPHFRTNTFVSA